MTTLYTIGDSVLDCGKYNEHEVTPGGLLVRNNDVLFPEFAGRDLSSVLGRPVTLVHRATDGARAADLDWQMRDVAPAADDIVLFSVGGNDLLVAFTSRTPFDVAVFQRAARVALERVARARVFVANIYDPTFGNDALNWLGVDPRLARRKHEEVNTALAAETARVWGAVLDLRAHFLTGRPSWFTRTIEPSLEGASEIRRVALRSLALAES